MLQNTSATAAFNGWSSTSFPKRTRVQQGSPLSPLLFVLAAQPLASHLRHQAQQGIIRPIIMPDGQPAPVSHQHADDTTLHVLHLSDAQAALDSSIALFCAATCSQLNVSMSQGFLVQAQPLASASVAALPSISFITGQQTIKHLGVLLGYDMQAASQQQFTNIYHAINAKVRHWAARGLSFLGRVHVAKQAKVISRLLEPERLAWKVFQLHHLSQASQVQPLGYGASILFSTLHTDQLQLPARISQPATSSAAIKSACPAAAASFLTPQQKPLMLSAGITKVAHLRLSLQLQQPQLLALELNSVLLALPAAWRVVVSSAPASTWFQVRSASGRQLIQDAQTGQLHTIGPHLQIQQVPSQPVLDPSPVQVISWDPSRPWRGPTHHPTWTGSTGSSEHTLAGPRQHKPAAPSQPQTTSHLFITCPVAATTQASSAAQHLGGVSDCPGQPANTSSRCLGDGRNPSVISFITTSIIYLTPWPPGEATSFEDYQGHDSQ
ncbi:MAG: reverse transcriptase [Trebouxia sp. A1-2]|nr:MAG: reverse transcriptase [Trebouxia sp. A1-2]